MNLFSTLPLLLDRWLAGGDFTSLMLMACASGLLLVLGVSALLLVRRVREQRRALERLERDLRIFTEASTRVADSLNQVLNAVDSEARAPGSSRRYVLQEARQALAGGDDLHSVSRRLGLCRDEVLLLKGLLERRRTTASTGQRIDQAA